MLGGCSNTHSYEKEEKVSKNLSKVAIFMHPYNSENI
jgi:hypothetical protein